MDAPDVKIAGFELWVHQRLDENWLDVTAHCTAYSSTVQVSGSILQHTELEHFLAKCKEINTSLSGTATLENILNSAASLVKFSPAPF